MMMIDRDELKSRLMAKLRAITSPVFDETGSYVAKMVLLDVLAELYDMDDEEAEKRD